MTLYEEALMMLDEARGRNAMKADMDGAIDELIVEAVKRIQADHDALMADHAEYERLLVSQTTKAETERIRSASHNQRVTWSRPVTDWRGNHV